MKTTVALSSSYDSAVILINPKYPFNLGGALRACAAFGSSRLHWTGERVTFNAESLPNEEKRKFSQQSVLFSHLPDGIQALKEENYIPVAVEIKESAEHIFHFEHPLKAVYIFGPEDGSLEKDIYRECYKFVYIPSHFCLNLAAAVNIILYDRRIKGIAMGAEPILPIMEILKSELPEIAISGKVRDGFQGK